MRGTGKFSIPKRIRSFGYAFKGIMHLIKYEHNARIHLVALIMATFFGVLLQIDPPEWIAIVLVSGIVLVSELFNTAIEKLADIAQPDWDERTGQLKDLSAGAVLVSAVIAVIVGGIIFVPRITERINALLNTFS